MIVREEIQSFERGLSPKKAMSVGIEAQIQKYTKENYNFELEDEEVLLFILEDSNLDKNTREDWVKFLIGRGYDFDENEWYELKNQGFEISQELPIGWKKTYDNILLQKGPGHFFINFSDWSDFAEYFADNKEISSEFIKDIFEGDGYKYFQYDSTNYEIRDHFWWIEKNQYKISALENLKKKFIEAGGKEENTEDIEEMMDIIAEDEDPDIDFSELEEAIRFALTRTDEIADEDAAFKELKNSLLNHYEIYEEDWNTDDEKYRGKITSDGAEKLLATVLAREEKIEYFPQRWSGNWDPDTFNMELENKLEDV